MSSDKVPSDARRAVSPRSDRLAINTTLEVKHRLQALADSHGWSLSKAGHMILVKGLKFTQAERDLEDLLANIEGDTEKAMASSAQEAKQVEFEKLLAQMREG
ncbi:MAG: hypothetical protein GTO24_14275 [candidate division Zixibacteria bacterium]|nr:hypothetical protein [candidate division Zixibacteria bacterium]